MVNKYKVLKRGAAAYYIVAFSTLILVIIATSFALVMLSEMTRSSNDELSQSAYDAALIGVEDAKLAFANYRRCVESGATGATTSPTNNTVNCSNIIYWVQHPSCDSVGKILGRSINDGTEVDIGGMQVSGTNNTSTNQAYTCAMIHTNLTDYRSTLSASKTRQTMRAEVGNGATNNVNKIKISWYSVRSDVSLATKNFNSGKVTFKELGSGNISVPPTLEVQIVQTHTNFKMTDFDVTKNGKTDRATLYLVPTTNDLNSAKSANNADSKNYYGTYSGTNKNNGINTISANQVAKTNDHMAANKPFLVYCNPDTSNDFYCSAEINLPGVINGSGTTRNNKTFMISLSLPYHTPDTDFAIELYCSDSKCGGTEEIGVGSDGQVALKNTQIAIDSTGRANDLYRRVEVRLEASDTTFASGFPNYALEILGDSGLTKKMKVTFENAFSF